MTNSLFIIILILVSISDIRYRRIPDKYIIVVGILGIVSIPFFLDVSIMTRLIGAVCVSIPMLLINMAVPGSFGGGDVKLMAVIGLYLGWQRNLNAFAIGILLAGVYCLVFMFLKRPGKRTEIALGPFLCTGAAISLFWGEILISWFMS